MIDRNLLMYCAVSQWNKPYLFGAKWPGNNSDPSGPVDCSGFTKWAWAQVKVDIPDGSTAQHAVSIPISPSILILPGDLVFLHTPLGVNDEHHVGMVYDKYFIIESRGIIKGGQEIGSIQLRTRKEWEARADFVGYFRPKACTLIEGV